MIFIMGDLVEAKGQLYICATPIGNLEDITLRVLRVLKEVDLIAAEDTRRTIKLLNHFEISTALTSYHEFNRKTKGRELVGKMLAGQNVALVSDAGMPGISDPGRELILECREAGINVTACPGPVASITGLVLSGIDARRYAFEGFLPKDKKEQRKILGALAAEERTMVFYEAPHRLLAMLNELLKHLGNRQAATARELTKKFEEVRKGLLVDLIEFYQQNPPRGEFVVIIEGGKAKEANGLPSGLAEHVEFYMMAGFEEKEAMKMTARDRKISKSEVYSMYKIKK